MTDIIEKIRARHEACGHIIEWPDFESFESHTDRATLLRHVDAMRARVGRLENLVCTLLENDPDDAVSDGGHTVLDLWRHEARAALGQEGGG